jgi:tetratricopeptide repeat protein
LLSNESDTFCWLAEGHPEVDAVANDAEGEQRDLDGWLQEQFWNEEEGQFYRYEEGGESVPDRSLCGMVPLVWRSRTAEVTEAIRPRTNEWKRTDWTPRSWILFFALLLHTSHHGVLAQMRAAGLPDGASELEEAVWAILRADSERRQLQLRGEVSPAVCWMDTHRRHLRQSLVALGVVLLIGWLGWQIFHREHAGETGRMDLERRARQACEDGQHGRAAALYGQAVPQGPALYFRYRQAGEWMHLEEFEEAEKGYRTILAEAPDTPNAQINLALAVWRQGRHEEALELYRAVATQHGAYPELAARAQLAVDLIERQQSLDR